MKKPHNAIPKQTRSPKRVEDAQLAEVRGAIQWTWTDGGITAIDDWETRA
jgi:hypothetical protein